MTERATHLGLVGGMSWVSTLDYYRLLNEGVNAVRGGLTFARLTIHSVDFGEFVANNVAGRWDLTLALLRDACHRLAAAEVDGIMLCANTAHAVIEPLKAEFAVPFIDVVDVTARAVSAAGLRRVALLGTQFTMELPFYREGLARHGIEAVVPRDPSQRAYIQNTLREELGKGIVRTETREAYRVIIDELVTDGCAGVIFGCTEIPLLLSQQDVEVPCFDTTRLHAAAGVEFLLR
jgi:aspartate racemase